MSSFREAGTAASQAASEQRAIVQGSKVYWGQKEKEVEALIPAVFAFFLQAFLLTQNQSASCRVPQHRLVPLTGACSNARGLVNLQKAFIHLNFFFFKHPIMKWLQSSTVSCSGHQPQQYKLEENNLSKWVKHPSPRKHQAGNPRNPTHEVLF